MSRRRLLAVAVPIAGMVLAFVILLTRIDPRATLAALGRVDAAWMLAAVGILSGTVGFAVLKVWLLFQAGGLGVPARRVTTAILASVALNAFIPGRGGDLVRAVFLVDSRAMLPRGVGIVLVERLVDLAVLGGLAAVAALWTGALPYAALGGAVTLGAAALIGLLSLGGRSPVFRDKASRVAEAVDHLRARKGQVALATLASAGTWSCNVLVLGCCLRAVGLHLPLPEVVSVAPLAILAGVLPLAPAGIGTRDLALVSLLPAQNADLLVAAAFLYSLLQALLLPAVGALSLGSETLATYRRLAAGASGTGATE